MASTRAQQLAEFLRTRRGRVRPADLGLEPGSGRKVTGLRREEMAMLAGVSTDYYQRIEQGRDVRPSDQVLDALARALNLTEDETRHLHMLGRALRRPAASRRRTREHVPDTTRRLLHTMTGPALVLGSHLDVLAWNALAGSLFGGLDAVPAGERNVLRAIFLNPDAPQVCPDWEASAIEYIGMLRAAAATDPDHPRLRELVGELSVRGPRFPKLWARHDVREKTRGRKVFHHPQAGVLTLDWDAYPLPGRPGPTLIAYTAVPGSADDERLRALASLLTTEPAPATPRQAATRL
ncbi:helix-turn-helix transcriptional regulator [Saccharopolyspora sp. NFXS83]|uniref:helix-turn-helix transcriptional regulator n=1 Tax=Saccharopolyspora sp. NFXS83 TaxID=2993560 RepID=UPI00224B7BA6|nr:helix-turn-helix transcriptional regulator [Saccharopolyspora sp. NFXS83]MCX2732616.1 helix-turn-helix transcriptional regulator [Saccharopolyspora sp. NFXS83]